MAVRVVLITGANRGLGRKTAERLLLESSDFNVIITARGAEEGARVCSELHSLGDFRSRLSFHPLDLSSPESVSQLKDYVQNTVGALDVLVNNAGIYIRGQNFNPEVARSTMETNCLATINLTESFLPIMRPGGQIVMVTSRRGLLSYVPSEELRTRLKDPGLSVDGVRTLAQEFVSSVADGTVESKGWPVDAYYSSKCLLNAYVRIRAPELQRLPAHLRLNAMCPGWVQTDMGGTSAPLTQEEGTEMHLQLIKDTSTSTCEFWIDRKVSEW